MQNRSLGRWYCHGDTPCKGNTSPPWRETTVSSFLCSSIYSASRARIRRMGRAEAAGNKAAVEGAAAPRETSSVAGARKCTHGRNVDFCWTQKCHTGGRLTGTYTTYIPVAIVLALRHEYGHIQLASAQGAGRTRLWLHSMRVNELPS